MTETAPEAIAASVARLEVEVKTLKDIAMRLHWGSESEPGGAEANRPRRDLLQLAEDLQSDVRAYEARELAHGAMTGAKWGEERWPTSLSGGTTSRRGFWTPTIARRPRRRCARSSWTASTISGWITRGSATSRPIWRWAAAMRTIWPRPTRQSERPSWTWIAQSRGMTFRARAPMASFRRRRRR